YWPATMNIGRIKPDVIHLEEEPDSLVALQTVIVRHIWARSARLILFTWQNIARPRPRLVRWLMTFVLHSVDCMIAGNAEAAHVLRAHGFKRPIHVLPQLGIDTMTFRPRDGSAMRERLGLTQFVVGYVGRFAP